MQEHASQRMPLQPGRETGNRHCVVDRNMGCAHAPERGSGTIRSTVLTVADGVRSNEGICQRWRGYGATTRRAARAH